MTNLLTCPRFMLVGGGTAGRIAEVLGRMRVERPLLVTDATLAETAMFATALDTLRESGRCVQVFADTVSTPTDTLVDKGLEMLKAGDFDGIVAFGGGSVMDTAKAMNVLYSGGGSLRDHALPEHLADMRVLPLLCVPTTAGTGSEASRFCAVTEEATGEHLLLSGLACVPEGAVIDYELTLDLPRRQTIDAGLNALTHALEAYVSRNASTLSDALALSALRLIGRALPKVVKAPHDAKAREDMMLGAMEAGMAFSDVSSGLTDGMSRAMSLFFRVPQGIGSAMLLPAVASFGLAMAPERYALAARAMGIATEDDDDDMAGAKLVGFLRRLCAELEVPSPRAFGIDEEEYMDALGRMATAALAPVPGAPPVASAEQVEHLYRQAYE